MRRLALLMAFAYSAHGMCPVNHTIELVFPHVPKAGGRTIEATFEGQAGGRHKAISSLTRSRAHNYFVKQGHNVYSKLARRHRCRFQSDGVAVHCRHGDCAPIVFILRDPINRFVSAFYTTTGRHDERSGHFSCKPGSAAWHMLRDASSTIEDWVRLPESERRNCAVDDRHVYFLAADEMNESPLETAKRRLKAIPWFAILERLPESLHLFRHAIDPELERITPAFNLNKYNKTLSPEALRVVQKHNQLDLQLYDFAVEEFDRRLAEAGGKIPTVNCDEDVICWDKSHSRSEVWSLQDTESAMRDTFRSEGEAKHNTLCAPRTGCLIAYDQNRKLSSPDAQPRLT